MGAKGSAEGRKGDLLLQGDLLLLQLHLKGFALCHVEDSHQHGI